MNVKTCRGGTDHGDTDGLLVDSAGDGPQHCSCIVVQHVDVDVL